jgi:Fe-S-cluster containining protein
MRGTDSPESPRCIALQGEVGGRVNCGIYEDRPSPCRDFEASFETGVENPRCAIARASKGLRPLHPEDWK